MKPKRNALRSKNGTPILPSPRQYKDPTMQGAKRRAAERELRMIVSAIKADVLSIIESVPKQPASAGSTSGQSFVREHVARNAAIVLNSSFSHGGDCECCGGASRVKNDMAPIYAIAHGQGLYANAREYNYQLNPSMMDAITSSISKVLRKWFLGTVEQYLPNWWLTKYINAAYMAGSREIQDSAEAVSARVASQDLLNRFTGGESEVAFEAGLATRSAMVGSRAFELMKGLTDQTRADLATVLFDAMQRGVGTVEIAKLISERINVSGSRATRIARTEINQAYRQSKTAETDKMNDDIYSDSEYEMKMLWFSALASTTRKWHASRHGKTYTTDEVAEFYSKDANAINCYCSQTVVLVNKKTGEVYQQDLVDKMVKQREIFMALNYK